MAAKKKVALGAMIAGGVVQAPPSSCKPTRPQSCRRKARSFPIGTANLILHMGAADERATPQLYRRRRQIDPITASVIQGALENIAIEMALSNLCYERTLNTTSCSRTCSTTFRPKSSFGPTSVAGA